MMSTIRRLMGLRTPPRSQDVFVPVSVPYDPPCGRCGGSGVIVDTNNRIEISDLGHDASTWVYGGKPCPMCRRNK